MHKLSTVIITFNEETRLRQTLESVRWCNEIIVVDSCSTDKTLEICKEYDNCKVYVQPFLGYGAQKKFAVEKASFDWILSVDADEVVTDGLRDEIVNVLSLPNIPSAGFNIPITLIFMKKVFKFGCEHKQLHLRLFNKDKGNFNTLKLHESIIVDGIVAKLKNEILHSSYNDIHHYFQKFNLYANIFKDEALVKGKKASKLKTLARFPLEFFKQYILRLNFLNGYPGFVWSLFSAFYVFVKYTSLYEANLKD
jgi:glycosyltransferase involved in cell wall biosynthesis